MKRWLLLLLVFFDVLVTIVCPPSSGIVFSGTDNLDGHTFTGKFSATFEAASEPYTMVKSELTEEKIVHITAQSTFAGSGNLGRFHLICRKGDDSTLTLLEKASDSFGFGSSWSTDFDEVVTLPAGTNQLVLSGDVKGLELRLEITDMQAANAA